MQFSGTEHFSQSQQDLWNRLTDLTLFARTLPHLDKVEKVEQRLLECRVRPGLSFLAGSLRLKFEVMDEQPPSSAKMRITGKGVGASVVVETSMRLATIETGTQLDWESEVLELGGLLKPVGRGLIEAAAQKVITDGWASFRAELAKG